ncbi:MAG: helix-turn-helix domain-containing protein [Actinobacteria bacterium]|nr:helix-turn-helix domain-containing protein [Actinomycetota bacterium]
MSGSTFEAQLAALCVLDESTRRRLYSYVAVQDEPVTRDHVSASLGIDRSLVAYHLDKLVESGLLAATFAYPDGRASPGPGRPAKRYHPAEGEIAVSVPPRDYRLAAEILARAAEADDAWAARQALDETAADLGRDLARSEDGGAALDAVLEHRGYQPYREGRVVRLRNCPFRYLVEQHTDLVCNMNLAFVSGLADVLDPEVQVRRDPAPDRCCVALHRV